MKKARANILKLCVIIHLVIFSGAAIWLVAPGSLARIIDQIDETMEFLFSTVPMGNYYLLVDATAQAAAMKVILLFVYTAIPVYSLYYLLCWRLSLGRTEIFAGKIPDRKTIFFPENKRGSHHAKIF
jgi:hypothetical protein